MSLKARLAAAEARLRKVKGPELLCIVVTGGLKSHGPDNFAQIGGLLWRREANETVDAFHRRVREAAIASGKRIVVFGGLPERAHSLMTG